MAHLSQQCDCSGDFKFKTFQTSKTVEISKTHLVWHNNYITFNIYHSQNSTAEGSLCKSGFQQKGKDIKRDNIIVSDN